MAPANTMTTAAAPYAVVARQPISNPIGRARSAGRPHVHAKPRQRITDTTMIPATPPPTANSAAVLTSSASCTIGSTGAPAGAASTTAAIGRYALSRTGLFDSSLLLAPGIPESSFDLQVLLRWLHAPLGLLIRPPACNLRARPLTPVRHDVGAGSAAGRVSKPVAAGGWGELTIHRRIHGERRR
jgi:hypothetical protein